MAYIGTDINYGNIAVQEGVGDGSDVTPIATLNYTVPTSASIMVTLDGVTQIPGVGKDFTASGTTLTFSTAPANLVKILVYFLGRSLDIGTPAAGTVTNASVDASAAIATSKLSGAVTSIPSHGLGALASLATVGNSQIDNNAVDEDKLKDALIADFTEVTVATGDSILLGDATDSGNTKRDTVQGILDLVPAAGGLYESIAIISDDKTTLVNGQSITLGGWRTRDLNTEVSDADGIVSISSNQFTLDAGTYTIEWFAMGYYIGTHVTRLYNFTDSSVTGWGSQPTSYASTAVDSSGMTVTTIAGSKVFELQHRSDTTQTLGGGIAQGHAGNTNRWATVKILKHS